MKEVSDFKWLGKKGNLPLTYFSHWWPLSTHEQRRGIFQMVNSVELVVKFQTIHIGKTIIENKQMRSVGGNGLQSVGASQMMMDAMKCFLFNHLNDERTDFLIIIDDENELDGGLIGSCRHVSCSGIVQQLSSCFGGQ